MTKKNKQQGEFKLDIKAPQFNLGGQDQQMQMPDISKISPAMMLMIVLVLGIIFGGYFIGGWFAGLLIGAGIALVFWNYWSKRKKAEAKKEAPKDENP